MDVTLVLIEPMLGTVPYAPEVYRNFIATKAPVPADGEAEVETVEEREERGWTGFHKDEQGLFLYDYQIKGMLKELALIAYPKDNEAKETGMKSKVERFVYVAPRRIYLGQTEADGVVERPLRASTAQGPRVTVVRSDFIAAGKRVSFSLHILPGPVKEHHLKTILALGIYRGQGQWRGGGYGRFTVENGA